MKKIIKAINDVFIAMILFVLYFIGIGLSFLIWNTKMFFDKKSHRSFWIEEGNMETTSYQSPY